MIVGHKRCVGEVASGVFRIGLLFCCAGVLILAGCRRSAEAAPPVIIQAEITPQPVVVGPATVTVRLKDAQGGPLTNARLTVEGDMSHPGMRPVFAEAKEVSRGRYQAQLQFEMAGDWVLLLHIKLPGGQTIERQVDVKGVRAE
jgi:hypothetical protein